jgi:hypothetical protein
MLHILKRKCFLYLLHIRQKGFYSNKGVGALSNSPKSKLFLVLALHRSGSSAVAGTLANLGINMGKHLLPATDSNPKGHFENMAFVRINEQLLTSLNGTWHYPPRREQVLSSNLTLTSEQIALLSEEIQPIWGLKDPRALITFDIWKPYLEEIADITYIFVHRPLVESIVSLANRHEISAEITGRILGLYSLNQQNFQTELESENKDIIHIEFSTLLERPETFVEQINVRINQPPHHNLEQVKQFLDKRLKNV